MLLSPLGADWFKNPRESLTHWLLNDSGKVLCLAGLCPPPHAPHLSIGGSIEEWKNLTHRACIGPAQIKPENRLT